MIVDTLTIITGCTLLLLAAATPFFNILFRRPRRQEDSPAINEGTSLPSFSIIISAHDKAAELERNLPAFLEQEYQGKFEVVVVDESSTDDTEDTLKRMKTKYPKLYTTFIPESSHYLSRRKLALTIGVKAAKYEWIIFTDADCCPDSHNWLRAMAVHCGQANSTTDIVMGYTAYTSEASDYEHFERTATWFRQAKKAKSTAFAYNGHNLAVRKQVFMEHNGFLANLKYLRGEYDFIVNEYAEEGNTVAVSEPSVRITQEAPTRKGWNNDRLYFIETSKHLDRRLSYMLPHWFDSTLMHLNLLLDIAAAALSATWGYYLITVAAVVSLCLSATLRVIISSKAMGDLNVNVKAWKVPLLQLCEFWVNIRLHIKHAGSDKYDFIRR